MVPILAQIAKIPSFSGISKVYMNSLYLSSRKCILVLYTITINALVKFSKSNIPWHVQLCVALTDAPLLRGFGLGSLLVGCGWIAWTATIHSGSEVPGGRDIHGVLAACKACGGARERQRNLGCTSPLAQSVRVQVPHRWFWSWGVQEDSQGRSRWTHFSLPALAKQVRTWFPSYPSSTIIHILVNACTSTIHINKQLKDLL